MRKVSHARRLLTTSHLCVSLLTALLLSPATGHAEPLTLRHALETSILNYGEIQAKESYRDAAQQDLSYARLTYLPDIILSAQQAFGTINAMHGPLYSPGGPANASTSLPLREQSWNAGFGALYSIGLHWNVLTFGKIDSQIELASKTHDLRQRELELARFQHQIRVSFIYLQLSTAQRIHHIQEENVARYEIALESITSHAESGLVPEVDASFARAELASAKSLKLKAYDTVLELSKELAVSLGTSFREFELEPTFYESAPALDAPRTPVENGHPLLATHEGRVQKSEQATQAASSEGLPSLFIFGMLQGRGSGFGSDYAQNQESISRSYFDGVGIERGNYIAGLGLSWNISSFLRSRASSAAQKYQTRALSQERELARQELVALERFADRKFILAHENRRHALSQREAATDGFRQSRARYDNGLGTIVELTQAIFTVSRAEVDFEIAQSAIWQALLLKAAASGDLNAFLQQAQGEVTQ